MSEQAGYKNEVWVLDGASAMAAGTGAKILGVNNSTFARLCDLLETTAFGDTNKKRIGGLKDTTITISGDLYVGDTTGQDVLVPGNDIYIGVMPSGPTVAGYQAPFLVESFEIASDVAGKQTFSATFGCTGAVVALPIRS
jgi:hypothetical protein